MDNLEAGARALLSEWEDVRVEQRGALWRISGLFRGAGYSAARENDPVSLARDMDMQARRTPAPILPPEVIEVERIVEVYREISTVDTQRNHLSGLIDAHAAVLIEGIAPAGWEQELAGLRALGVDGALDSAGAARWQELENLALQVDAVWTHASGLKAAVALADDVTLEAMQAGYLDGWPV